MRRQAPRARSHLKAIALAGLVLVLALLVVPRLLAGKAPPPPAPPPAPAVRSVAPLHAAPPDQAPTAAPGRNPFSAP